MTSSFYTLSKEEARSILETNLQIQKALQYLHEDSRKEIIHRDIKPENILVSVNKHTEVELKKKANKETATDVSLEFLVKICDFGLAKEIVEDDQTATGLKGTFVYMAPEIITRSSSLDPGSFFTFRGDIYASGLVFQYTCTKKELYKGERYLGRANSKVITNNNGKEVPNRKQPVLPSHFPNDIRRLALIMIHYDPKKRPAATANRTQFENWLKDKKFIIAFQKALDRYSKYPGGAGYKSHRFADTDKELKSIKEKSSKKIKRRSHSEEDVRNISRSIRSSIYRSFRPIKTSENISLAKSNKNKKERHSTLGVKSISRLYKSFIGFADRSRRQFSQEPGDVFRESLENVQAINDTTHPVGRVMSRRTSIHLDESKISNKARFRKTIGYYYPMRKTFTAGEIDKFSWDKKQHDGLSNSKLCFGCRVRWFGVFARRYQCPLCTRVVCHKCLRKAQIHLDQLQNEQNINQASLDNLNKIVDSNEDENQKNQWFYDLPVDNIKVDMQNASSDKDSSNLECFEFQLCVGCFDFCAELRSN